MKSLLDTSIYYFYEKRGNFTSLPNFLRQYTPELDNLKLEYLDEQLALIRKRYLFPMKNNILQETLVNKTLIPIYNPTRVQIPIFIPAMLMSRNGKFIALCNTSTLVNRVDESIKRANIEPIKLYAMLQAGYTLIKCKEHWKSLQVNQDILSIGSFAYSSMFCKILDKLYAINIDTKKSDTFMFLTSMFFLVNLLEKDVNDNTKYLAMKNCTNMFGRGSADSLMDQVPPESFNNLESFINLLTTFEGMKSLNLRTYLENYARLFGTGVLFGIEYFPYFLFGIFNTAISANLNHSYVLEPLIGKRIDQLFVAFANCTNR